MCNLKTHTSGWVGMGGHHVQGTDAHVTPRPPADRPPRSGDPPDHRPEASARPGGPRQLRPDPWLTPGVTILQAAPRSPQAAGGAGAGTVRLTSGRILRR